MELLKIEGNTVRNLPDDAGDHARILECATREEFDAWCGAGEAMACRFEEQVTVKAPQKMEENGEFSLEYDCVLIDEANARIAAWNARGQGRAK